MSATSAKTYKNMTEAMQDLRKRGFTANFERQKRGHSTHSVQVGIPRDTSWCLVSREARIRIPAFSPQAIFS